MSRSTRLERRRRTGDASGRRARGERGATLVELAFLLPILFLLAFGMIELSSAYQSSADASSAARAGARTASAEPLTSSYATDAATAAATALHTVSSNEPQAMWIFKADPTTGLPASGGFTTCSTNCISYAWLPASRTFDTAHPGGGGWAASAHNACVPSTWDYVGVYISLKHYFMTRLLGTSINLAGHSVFRLEPAAAQLCP